MDMSKRVFIVHGWEGTPNEGWFPWLKSELEKKGFKVNVPAMPNTAEPKIDPWVSHLEKQVGIPDKDTYLVGHSIGCQAILRYLERLPKDIKVGGLVLVAGFVNLVGLTNSEKIVVKPWLTEPILWKNILQHTKNFVSIFSDNDTWVLPSESEIFRDKLGAKVVEQKAKGHFSGDDGIKKLPVVLKELSNFF